MITATGTAVTAILTAVAKLAQVLRERRDCTCRHECPPGKAPAPTA